MGGINPTKMWRTAEGEERVEVRPIHHIGLHEAAALLAGAMELLSEAERKHALSLKGMTKRLVRDRLRDYGWLTMDEDRQLATEAHRAAVVRAYGFDGTLANPIRVEG